MICLVEFKFCCLSIVSLLEGTLFFIDVLHYVLNSLLYYFPSSLTDSSYYFMCSGSHLLFSGEKRLVEASKWTVMNSASVSGESSLSDMIQTVHFSSGNPRIGETRGVMHLISDNAVSSSSSSSSSNLPVIFLSSMIHSSAWLHRFLFFTGIICLNLE